MLFPMMDMFFILLMFFLVNIGIKDEGGEKAYKVAVPTESMGEAQILLQMVGVDSVLWLDNTTFHHDWRQGFPQSHIIPVSLPVFREKLGFFYDTYGRCLRKEVLTVIRCSGDLTYGDVEALQDSLSIVFSDVMQGFSLKLSLLEAGPLDAITVNQWDDNEVDIQW
jgi:hypothetical protein